MSAVFESEGVFAAHLGIHPRTSAAAPAVLSSGEAWDGKKISLSISGRIHRNGPEVTKTYSWDAVQVGRNQGLGLMIAELLEAAKTRCPIPADLVSGVSFQFVDME